MLSAILIIILCAAGILFAQEQKEKLEVNPKTISKALPAYKINLKQLIAEAERNILKVDKAVRKEELLKKTQEREKLIREYFEKGRILYNDGKLKEAREEWKEALKIAKDPLMRDYLKKLDKKSEEEERLGKKEELEIKKRQIAEEKELERLEARKKYQRKLMYKAQKRKQKEEQERLKEQKQKSRGRF